MPDLFEHSAFPDVDRYLLSVFPRRDAPLARMERYGIERGFPFVGPLVGEYLSLMAKAIGARRVFEMGSGFGYSAVYLARAVPADGRIICTDGDPENERVAADFLRQTGVAGKIEWRVGDAVKILGEYDGPFDLIMMDIDKEGYVEGFRAAWPKVRPGGLFIADNLLWHGRVFGHDDRPTTQAIRDFTRVLYQTPNAQTSILPLRDGLSVTLKLA